MASHSADAKAGFPAPSGAKGEEIGNSPETMEETDSLSYSIQYSDNDALLDQFNTISQTAQTLRLRRRGMGIT